jgi:hypothetical protein
MLAIVTDEPRTAMEEKDLAVMKYQSWSSKIDWIPMHPRSEGEHPRLNAEWLIKSGTSISEASYAVIAARTRKGCLGYEAHKGRVAESAISRFGVRAACTRCDAHERLDSSSGITASVVVVKILDVIVASKGSKVNRRTRKVRFEHAL